MVRPTTVALLISILVVMFALYPGDAFAQSTLPPCPSDQTQRYDNCFGTYTYADGSKYVGEWKDNKKSGHGTLTFGEGEWKGAKYVGEFVDDLFNRQGTFTFADGVKYVGEWNIGKYNGKGTFYAANGSVLKSGLWENNELVKAGPDEQVVVDGDAVPQLANCHMDECGWYQIINEESVKRVDNSTLYKISALGGSSTHSSVDEYPNEYNSSEKIEWSKVPRTWYILCAPSMPSIASVGVDEKYWVDVIDFGSVPGMQLSDARIIGYVCNGIAYRDFDSTDFKARFGYRTPLISSDQIHITQPTDLFRYLAQPETLGEVRGWTITHDGSGDGACYASAGYRSGTTLTVGKVGPNASWIMQFVNPKWSSIVVGSQYDTSLIFNGRKAWTASNTGIENGIRSESLKDEVIADFARSSGLELKVNNKHVDGFDLTGTRAASDAVARCYKDRVEDSDPFAPTSSDPFAAESEQPQVTVPEPVAEPFRPEVEIQSDGTVKLTRTGDALKISDSFDIDQLSRNLTGAGYHVEISYSEGDAFGTWIDIKYIDQTILAILGNVETKKIERIQSMDPVWIDSIGSRGGTLVDKIATKDSIDCDMGEANFCRPHRADGVVYLIDICGVAANALPDEFQLSRLSGSCSTVYGFQVVAD